MCEFVHMGEKRRGMTWVAALKSLSAVQGPHPHTAGLSQLTIISVEFIRRIIKHN